MFFEKKKCEGTIPLNNFRKSNAVEGKAKLRDDGIVLSVFFFERVDADLLVYPQN